MKSIFNLQLIFVILIFLYTTSCDYKSDRPTQEFIKSYNGINDLIIDDLEINGIYHNQDVDALLFYYKTRITSSSVFWEKLEKIINEKNWRQLAGTSEIKRYELIDKSFSSGIYAKEIRIAYVSNGNYVLIGIIEGGPNKILNSFSELEEAKWADKWLWPKFEDTYSLLTHSKVR